MYFSASCMLISFTLQFECSLIYSSVDARFLIACTSLMSTLHVTPYSKIMLQPFTVNAFGYNFISCYLQIFSILGAQKHYIIRLYIDTKLPLEFEIPPLIACLMGIHMYIIFLIIRHRTPLLFTVLVFHMCFLAS